MLGGGRRPGAIRRAAAYVALTCLVVHVAGGRHMSGQCLLREACRLMRNHMVAALVQVGRRGGGA